MAHPLHPEGVPLDVWLPDRQSSPDGASLRFHMAARLIDAYSPPAGVVVDLLASDVDVLNAALERGRSGVLGSLAYACRRPAVGSLTAKADLAVSLPPASHLAPPRHYSVPAPMAASLCRRAASLLRPGGFLVLASVGRGSGELDAPTQAVVAATDAGLAYFQHVVMLLDARAPEAVGENERSHVHADLMVFTRRQP